MAIFSKLLPAITTAYAVQTVGGIISIPLQEDRLYDFFGMLGFLTTGAVSLYPQLLKGTPVTLETLTTLPLRQKLLNGAVGIWALRLGLFLFHRALKHGGDSRLTDIKKRPKRFARVWFGQGAWTLLVGLPLYLVNVLPKVNESPLGYRDIISLTIVGASFFTEVLADYQKMKWRNRKDAGKHNEKYINSGLWSISRHPNYASEISFWTGIWAFSTKALEDTAHPRLAPVLGIVSPLFSWFLLTKVSGIPLIEKQNNMKFGDDPRYRGYIQRVPVLWPWISRSA